MISTGYFVALGLGGWILAERGPAASFFVPAAALAIAMPLVACVVADRPEDVRCVQLVTAGSLANQHQPTPAGSAGGAYRLALIKLVNDPIIRATMLGLFGTGWVREGFLSWFGSFLQAEHGIDVGSAGHSAVAMAITLGGMGGSLTVGVISDRCCGSQRAPVVLACTISQAALLLIFPVAMRAATTAADGGDAGGDDGGAAAAVPVAVLMCGALSVPLFGALTLLMAAASVELVEPALSGTASGLLNMAQYVGSGCVYSRPMEVSCRSQHSRCFPAAHASRDRFTLAARCRLSTLAAGAAVEWLGYGALFGSLALGAVMSTAGMARVIMLQRARARAALEVDVAVEKQPMVATRSETEK